MTLAHHTLGVLGLLAAVSPAQSPTVILSEINPASTGAWIELENLTATSQDISSWSIYQATKTPGMPHNYWFGFPPGTIIEAGGILRVHWLQPVPATPVPGEVFTGETIYHFLFGYWAEPLDPNRGAIALLNTQQNALMNTPASFVDWVSWGEGNFVRENFAAQAGVWEEGRFVTAIAGQDSLARVPRSVGVQPQPERNWFHDASPTPGQPNGPGLAAATVGSPCTQAGNHLFGPPVLAGRSFPIAGNRDFGLTIDNTSGFLGETAIVVFSGDTAPVGQPALLPPTAGPACPELLDYSLLIGFVFVSTGAGQTVLPFGFDVVPSALMGTRFVVQAVILDAFTAQPPYQGVTNGVDFLIGG